MGTTLEKKAFAAPVELGVADAVIAGLKQRLEGAVANTPAGYEIVRKGIGECRTLRVQAKNAHKELKQSALEWGRACDAELRRVNGMIEAVELPLKEEKQRVDDEKDRIRREKVEKQRREAEEKERAERVEREKAEAAERERFKKEQEAESKRLADENRKLQERIAEQQMKNREEEERIAAERKKVEDERAAIEKEKRDRDAAEQLRRQAEEDKLRKAAEAKEQAERNAEAKRLREERKPDAVKLLELCVALDAYELPSVKTAWAVDIVDSVRGDLKDIAAHWREAIELTQ